METTIRKCYIGHLQEYGRIYAAAFSGEPWNDPWNAEDATVHVREILESQQSYGIECVVDGKVAGFLLGTSMLFHYGRTFEINDLAVDPRYQGYGIAKLLMDRAMKDLKEMGIVAVHLITAAEGWLKDFYAEYGFKKEERVILMGMEMDGQPEMGADGEKDTREMTEQVETMELFRTSQSWDGAELPDYLRGRPELVAVKYVFPAGKKLGWHNHEVMNFGVLVQGELTIVAIDGTEKMVHEGEAVVEMVGTVHHGENRGSKPAVLYMFYLSGKDKPLAVQHPEITIEQ